MKKFVPLFVFVITVVLAGSVTVWYFTRHQQLEKINVDKHDKETLQKESDSKQGIESGNVSDSSQIENWKTYTNQNLGFAISYPKDWTLEVSQESQRLYLVSPERKQKLTEGIPSRVFDVSVAVYFRPADFPRNQDKKLNFDEWIESETDVHGFSGKQVTFKGEVGYEGVSSGGIGIITYTLYVKHGDYVYDVSTGDTDTPTAVEQAIIDSIIFIN